MISTYKVRTWNTRSFKCIRSKYIYLALSIFSTSRIHFLTDSFVKKIKKFTKPTNPTPSNSCNSKPGRFIRCCRLLNIYLILSTALFLIIFWSFLSFSPAINCDYPNSFLFKNFLHLPFHTHCSVNCVFCINSSLPFHFEVNFASVFFFFCFGHGVLSHQNGEFRGENHSCNCVCFFGSHISRSTSAGRWRYICWNYFCFSVSLGCEIAWSSKIMKMKA